MSKLIVLSGPSGAGKSTIVKHLLENNDLNLTYSISVTSRSKRPGEVDGKDYYFMSIDEFKERIDENRFLEWEEVYPNQYYGTLKSDIDLLLSQGKNVIFDIDVMGAINIKRHYKDITLSIFIKPPSVEELEKRLKERNTETEANLKKRVRKANMELHYARKFHHVITNEDLEAAKQEAVNLVTNYLSE